MILPFTDLDERALKTATGDLIDAAGGVTRASELLGRPDGDRVKPYSVSRLSEYANLSDMERSMPVRLVSRLEIRVGLPIVSGFMAARLQRDGSVPVGTLCQTSSRNLRRALRDLEAEVDEATADGNVTSAERAAIREDITLVELQLAALKAKVMLP
ncbi:hypothetical protein ACLNGM_09925 [Aureimonas phyllosphaerae]|uniref:hypothetical protein n=1 Tax=Aureimonas phyllosphaerae TaxID=1166078 RepID=UPI003A5C6168